MADLLIKGMKMPKNCSYCDLYDIATDWCEAINDEILGFDPLATRFDGCPLVEVPTPHGRLIDADRALGRMWNALYALEDKREEQHGLDVMERANIQDGFEAGQRVVADAPTVIEESEDGEQDGKL